MKFAIKNIYILLILWSLFIFPVQAMHEGTFYPDAENQPFNVTQNREEGHLFELSKGQIRSRVEHQLVNLLLGKTIDQYLDFGAEDDVAKKSSQRFKIRVGEHKLFIIYQRQFH